jgi:hypothetical protein
LSGMAFNPPPNSTKHGKIGKPRDIFLCS